MAEEDAYVDNHAHSNQEIWNEERIAHKLEARHQGTCLGNETVDYQACKERSKQSFETHHLGQRSADEDESQDEDELHDTVLVATQEPASHPWEHQNGKGNIQPALQAKEKPGHPRCVGTLSAYHHRQNQQGGKKSDGSRYDTHDDRSVPIQAVTSYDWVRYEGMTGIDAGQQEAGRESESKQPDTRNNSQDEGNRKGEDAESEARSTIQLHASHLELQACQEHYIIYADLTEEFERAIMRKKIEAILPHQDACDDESHDWRHPELPEHQRRKQNDGQHHREAPRRIGDERSSRNGLKGTEKHHLSRVKYIIRGKVTKKIAIMSYVKQNYFLRHVTR